MAIQFYYFLILWTALTLFGCAPGYSYNHVNYPTSEAALEAVKKDAAEKIKSVVPRQTAVNLSAKVVVPNLKQIAISAVLRRGSPDIDQINYVAKVIYLGYRGMAIALAKRNIFARVDFKEAFDTESPTMEDYDILIWLHINKKGQGKWYFKNSVSKRKIGLEIDLKSSGTDVLLSWLNSIEENVEKMHSNLKRKSETEKAASFSYN